jgi:hypothetical protein
MLSNKGMKLTKLRAAPERAYKVPPCARSARMGAGTASQLIPGVGRTCLRSRVRLLTAVTTLLGACLAACAYQSNVRMLVHGSPAERYVAEFEAAETQYPGGERGGSKAPVGDAEVVLKLEPAIPLIADSCHSVWLRTPTERKRILTMREADPGSGSSFGFAWSRDGQAAFIFGDHSGIDCPRGRDYGELRIIYTLADGVPWMVPQTPGRPTRG